MNPVHDVALPRQRSVTLPLVDGSLEASPSPLAGGWNVVVSVSDRPGLLALLAGALTLCDLDIVSASIHDRGRQAHDEFCVTAPAGTGSERWRLLASTLDAVLSGALSLPEQLADDSAYVPLAEPRIVFETSSDFTTGIRVRTPDRRGLLHDLALAISDAGLDIRAVTLLTISGFASDTFRVRDRATGEPPRRPDRLESLRRAIAAAAVV